MKRLVVYCAGALLVTVPLGFMAYLAGPALVAPAEASAPADPTEELKDISARTGDTFWGLHLDGVIPCSPMVVKGGGHLVILAPVDNPQAKCNFHVKDVKTVQLAGKTFQIKVTGDDQVHVVRGVPLVAAKTE